MRSLIGGRPGGLGRIVLLVTVALLVVACGGAGGAQVAPVGDEGGFGYDLDRGPISGAPEVPADDEPTRVYDAARPDLLIIKTGSLELQVEAVDPAVEAAVAAVTDLGGYVAGSEQAGDGEDKVASVTLRIPAEAWERALTRLRALAIKVVSERTNTQEVTGQVVDLAARIRNLRATEEALQAIMVQATKIPDVLAVQSELTKVRGEIESLSAQKARLEEQAAFSTLTASFSREPEPATVTSQRKFDPQSEVDRATASLVEVLQGLATAGIWFAIVWLPILVVLGLVTLAALVVVRRRRTGAPRSVSEPEVTAPAP
jgi:hypothetical protein